MKSVWIIFSSIMISGVSWATTPSECRQACSSNDATCLQFTSGANEFISPLKQMWDVSNGITASPLTCMDHATVINGIFTSTGGCQKQLYPNQPSNIVLEIPAKVRGQVVTNVDGSKDLIFSVAPTFTATSSAQSQAAQNILFLTAAQSTSGEHLLVWAVENVCFSIPL